MTVTRTYRSPRLLNGLKKSTFIFASVIFLVLRYLCPPYENVHVGFFIHTSRKRKKSTVNSYNLILYHFHTKSKGKQPYNKTKFKLNRKRKNKLTNGHGGVIIQLRAAIFERIRNAPIKAFQTVSISLLSATFSCVLRLWFKRCCYDVVYNDVTRDFIACSLTLHHVTENRYVKYPVQNSWRYESIVLTNRIAGKRMNIKKIKSFESNM